MHPYIPHLIEDIKAAHRAEIPEKNNTPQSMEEHFEEIEAWVRGDEPENTFGYHCGLRSENFPPPEQLTEKEMKLIRKEIEKMMYTWNVAIHLPERLPVDFAYKMIVDTLERNITIVKSGRMNIDFCTGYAPDCDLKEYCSCLEIWNNPLDIDISSIPDFSTEVENNFRSLKNKSSEKEEDDNSIPQ